MNCNVEHCSLKSGKFVFPQEQKTIKPDFTIYRPLTIDLVINFEQLRHQDMSKQLWILHFFH